MHPHPCNNIKGNPVFNRVYFSNSETDTRTKEDNSYLFFDSPDTEVYQPPLGTLLNTETFINGKMFYADLGPGDAANEGSNPPILIDDPLLYYMADTVSAGYLFQGINNPTTERVRRLKASKYVGANTIDGSLSGFTGGIGKVDNQKRSFTTILQPAVDTDRLPRTIDNTFLHGHYHL